MRPAKDRRIEFVLSAPRSDVAESRRAGFLSRIAHRLAGIEVKVGATLDSSLRAPLHRRAPTPSARCSNRWSSTEATRRRASHAAPFVTSFAYHSNVAAGTTGWQLANWSWPAGTSLVDASRQDKGVRLADVDGDARPDLVKALATLSNPDPKLATFTLSADSGVFLNTGDGFASVPSPAHPLPSFARTERLDPVLVGMATRSRVADHGLRHPRRQRRRPRRSRRRRARSRRGEWRSLAARHADLVSRHAQRLRRGGRRRRRAAGRTLGPESLGRRRLLPQRRRPGAPIPATRASPISTATVCPR